MFRSIKVESPTRRFDNSRYAFERTDPLQDKRDSPEWTPTHNRSGDSLPITIANYVTWTGTPNGPKLRC